MNWIVTRNLLQQLYFLIKTMCCNSNFNNKTLVRGTLRLFHSMYINISYIFASPLNGCRASLCLMKLQAWRIWIWLGEARRLWDTTTLCYVIMCPVFSCVSCRCISLKPQSKDMQLRLTGDLPVSVDVNLSVHDPMLDWQVFPCLLLTKCMLG